MVCQACGGPVGPDVKFCAHCGAQVVAPPPQYAPPAYGAPSQQYAYVPPPMMMSRVQHHLQTLGTLWLVYAAYRVVTGLFGMFFVRAVMYRRWNGWNGGGFPFGHHGFMYGPPWMQLMPAIVSFLVIGSVLAAVVGYSLLTRRTWGRVLAIVAAVLVLFKPILGTALGIYTLWVLAPALSGMEYDAIAEPD